MILIPVFLGVFILLSHTRPYIDGTENIIPSPLNRARWILSEALTTAGSESLTGLDILSGLGDRVHLTPVSVLQLSR